ncbi:MAG: sigma-E factor negative regulatory protein [Proteobacteria bacterium]|nr:sigma-E factor negative regulatory protein [Pseudomonadota bacterium]
MTADPVRAAVLERLSALADGELDAPATAEACAAWRDDASLRISWHRYQLIGDVLRSDDLVSDGVRDAAFLAGLRARLAAEPVVLAPQMPVDAFDEPARNAANGVAVRRRSAWRAPAAVAAGFFVVAGALLLLRDPAPLPGDAPVGGGLRPTAAPVPVAAISFGPQIVTGSGVVRDPRLDRYLAAHKEFAGNSALGLSPMYLRSASVEVPAR